MEVSFRFRGILVFRGEIGALRFFESALSLFLLQFTPHVVVRSGVIRV
jgi:hypothetical protein